MTIARMRRSMTQREFERWRKYWAIEPWGPWRANMHAAILAQAMLLPHVKKGAKIRLDDFMIMDPQERASKQQREANQALMAMLRTMAQSQPGGPRRRKGKKVKG
jgi:hypothetical protein